jgi:cytochrome c oxidase subunit 2
LSRTLFATALWTALVAALPPAAAYADEGRGEALFSLCAQCHGSAGEGNPEVLAPAIAGLDQWYVEAQLAKFRSGVRGTHPQDTGGLRMYPMSLWLASDADAAAVARYVASLPAVRSEPRLTGGDAQRGQQLFAPCVACHGVDGGGNEAMKAPALTGASDWYLLSSLQKYKAGIRGANPADQTGAIMRAMSSTLADEQAMRDVIAYIATLPQ